MVSDLMYIRVAQRPDFKSAVRVVKMVLNTQCYQYLWLTMWYHAKWSIIKGHRLSRECDILLILCSNLLSGILCLLSLILKMLGKIIWFVDVQTKYFPDEDNCTRSFVPLNRLLSIFVDLWQIFYTFLVQYTSAILKTTIVLYNFLVTGSSH